MLADGSLKPLDGALRQKVQAVIDDMASKALRCMTLAQKTELGELRGCQCGMGKLMSCSWQHALADPSSGCSFSIADPGTRMSSAGKRGMGSLTCCSLAFSASLSCSGALHCTILAQKTALSHSQGCILHHAWTCLSRV